MNLGLMLAGDEQMNHGNNETHHPTSLPITVIIK